MVTTAADGASSVYAADPDSDGDLDVFSASSFDGKVAWYENTDGAGTLGEQKIISTAADGTRSTSKSVYAADLDGDGDVDVLESAVAVFYPNNGSIAWYENTDSKGNFAAETVISAVDGLRSVHVADLDGDGDLDVLLASFDQIAWHENTDGKGNFGAKTVISEDGGLSVYAADLDGDGDQDVLFESHTSYSTVVWYENLDGTGDFAPRGVVANSPEDGSGRVTDVFATDIDGDGDVDVVANYGQYFLPFSKDKIVWYENRLAGDANDDGEVALEDFATLAGNFGRTDASWEDGDFDGDGEVDFSDFVILAGNFGHSRPKLQTEFSAG